jgi:hypothetical protein
VLFPIFIGRRYARDTIFDSVFQIALQVLEGGRVAVVMLPIRTITTLGRQDRGDWF